MRLTHIWVMPMDFRRFKFVLAWIGPRKTPGMISCASLRISYLLSASWAWAAGPPWIWPRRQPLGGLTTAVGEAVVMRRQSVERQEPVSEEGRWGKDPEERDGGKSTYLLP